MSQPVGKPSSAFGSGSGPCATSGKVTCPFQAQLPYL